MRFILAPAGNGCSPNFTAESINAAIALPRSLEAARAIIDGLSKGKP